MTSIAAQLRVFARIEDPSDELFDYLATFEKVQSPAQCWVDLATPRNFEYTDEIRQRTVEFGIADETGEVLATFETLAEAEMARGKARIKIALAFEDEGDDEAPRGAPAKEAPVTTSTDSKTGKTTVGTAAGL